MTPIDSAWLDANPLPDPAAAEDKNSRGRVLAVGGSDTVPGALRLTGEAAFRAGAGKVQLATPKAAAATIGVHVPEAAVFALEADDDGEIAARAADRIVALLSNADAVLLGPGIGDCASAQAILRAVCRGNGEVPLLIDAGLLCAVPTVEADVTGYGGPRVFTPHPGEMAQLMDCDAGDIGPELASAAADRFAATVVMKSTETWVATPGGPVLHYTGGGPGLATGGSGDVLAGVIGGLLARGAEPHVAAAWGVWLHGEAGRRLAGEVGTIGFLARELLPLIPRLMAR